MGEGDTLVILQSDKIKGRWTKPVRVSFSATDAQWKDIDPIFSPDGKTVLFQSTRPVPDRPNRTGFDIWAVDKTATGWTAPYHLGNVMNTDASESYASVTRKGDIYFMKDHRRKRVIRISMFQEKSMVFIRNQKTLGCRLIQKGSGSQILLFHQMKITYFISPPIQPVMGKLISILVLNKMVNGHHPKTWAQK